MKATSRTSQEETVSAAPLLPDMNLTRHPARSKSTSSIHTTEIAFSSAAAKISDARRVICGGIVPESKRPSYSCSPTNAPTQVNST